MKFLQDKPGTASHWMASAAAAYLIGDLTGAIRLLDAYEQAQRPEVRSEVNADYLAYSHSEARDVRRSLRIQRDADV